jgi:pantetheine-phosphate adenylyltransferase
MNVRHALYPGTFDPVTNGHLDILHRALALFEQVTVAVAQESRAGLFSCEERVAFLKNAVAAWPRCRVVPFNGLLVDELRRREARVVIRGIRSILDLEGERAQATLNQILNPGCEYVFLMARPELMAVSSTLVRDISRHGGDVTGFTPPVVAAALAARNGGN